MTNEMKLLTALCDALGFDIDKVCVNQKALDRYTSQFNRLVAMSSDIGGYNLKKVEPIYEYKLTKRDDTEHEDAELAAIVRARSGQSEVKVSWSGGPLAQFKAGYQLSLKAKD